MIIERVIAGGQAGADRAGWDAAKAAGFPTGGWMPRGYLAEDGRHPEFAKIYGAKEMPDDDYPARTRMNAGYVADEAGAIVCFDANERMSPGSKLLNRTANDLIARGFNVSLTMIRVARVGGIYQPANLACGPSWVAKAIINRPGPERRLMVAGNRESSAPGIYDFVLAYMAEVFDLLKAGER